MRSGTFHAHGKLLITGEYLVLRGALALAVPLRLGQSLSVRGTKLQGNQAPRLRWQSLAREEGWFRGTFDLEDFSIVESSDASVARRLQQIFSKARKLKADFLSEAAEVEAQSLLEFDRRWGLGSSSTLIANIAQWADVDPFLLLRHSFGGSGYDVACALSEKPILYQKREDRPSVEAIDWRAGFLQELYFVYLGQKQDSQREVEDFQSHPCSLEDVEEVSRITQACAEARDLRQFSALIERHEAILARILGRPCVQQADFPDFPGVVKSLGAWGGDFVMAIKPEEMTDAELRNYFRAKGKEVVFAYGQLVL